MKPPPKMPAKPAMPPMPAKSSGKGHKKSPKTVEREYGNLPIR